MSEAEKIPGNLFFRGVRHQGIGARQVYKDKSLSVIRISSLGVGHGFAGPVSGVLFHAGQAVENSAFAYIRIAGQGDNPVVGMLLLYRKFRIHGFCSG